MNRLAFSQVVIDITSRFNKIKQEDYLKNGLYKIIDQGKAFIAGYTNEKSLQTHLTTPIIVFGDHTKIIKYIDFDITLGADGAKALLINSDLAYCKYVYYYFKTIKLPDAGYSRHFKFLKAIKIPVPNNIDDQIRIATLLSRAESLIAKRKESIRLLDELLKSTFLEMFGDPVRNEMGWEKKCIDDIAEVRVGPFGSLLHAEDYVVNGIPLINPSHIIDGEITPDNMLTISPVKFKELEPYHLKINDVVVARRGEIGRCAIVRTTNPLFCGTGSMFIRITTDYYPLLLQYQIFNTSLKEYLLSKAKGVTMKNLNSTTLGNLQILCPPMAFQNKFAAIVTKVESLKTQYIQSLTELENLYNSLSQRAFKGELDLSRVPVEKL
jgi:type I restriction enzyme S subunit